MIFRGSIQVTRIRPIDGCCRPMGPERKRKPAIIEQTRDSAMNIVKWSCRSIVVTTLLSSALCFADVQLPDVLGSGMVLQRNHRVPIWGKADPDEVVTVSFSGQAKRAKADQQGQWRVELDAM